LLSSLGLITTRRRNLAGADFAKQPRSPIRNLAGADFAKQPRSPIANFPAAGADFAKQPRWLFGLMAFSGLIRNPRDLAKPQQFIVVKFNRTIFHRDPLGLDRVEPAV
jgi:hypothetical protein